jgi:general secretion pathway protein D
MVLLASALLAACAVTLDEADRLSRAGDYEAAYATLDDALARRPDDAALRSAHARQRDRIVVRALAQAELALGAGRLDEAGQLLQRVRQLDPGHARRPALEAALQRQVATQRLFRDAQRSLADGQGPEADRLLAELLSIDPQHAGARALQRQRQRTEAGSAAAPPAEMAAAFRKPVTLEFREAPLRQVFEALARSSNVNFVFDKDVRGDARVTVFLRDVTLDEAMRVILTTQQLDRRLLNDSTVLIYPNTPAKQREHQQLITRSLYLVNADVKQALALVRTMAKTRDLHADERLNALVVRDTPEVVRQVEQLLATVDLPEPEVMLAIEVMEVASDKLDELGLSWPTAVNFGIPNATGEIALGDRGDFRASVANPALAATLRGSRGTTNLLANPTIRARNREKAKVQIGEKLPVFTTTTAVNVGTSASVSYLDIGLKLEVEPQVQLDGEVTIKVSLEVSNLLREVTGPSGSLAYQVGSRLTTTSLRLKDGETQVLAGLINDEDRKRAVGIPGLSQLPLIGRLFGVHSDTRNKTEIVMLITPRIIRNLAPPDVSAASFASGTDALPGAEPLRLRRQARVAVPANRGGAAGPPAAAEANTAALDSAPRSGVDPGVLAVSATTEASVGETVSIALVNRSAQAVRGELEFDPTLLQTTAGEGRQPGRAGYAMGPGQDSVVVLRVLPAAAGGTATVGVSSATATTASGETSDLRVEGQASIRIRPTPEPPQ